MLSDYKKQRCGFSIISSIAILRRRLGVVDGDRVELVDRKDGGYAIQPSFVKVQSRTFR